MKREILKDGDGDGSGNINENIKRTDLNLVKVTQCTEMKEIDGYKEGSRWGREIPRINCESNCFLLAVHVNFPFQILCRLIHYYSLCSFCKDTDGGFWE